MNYPNYISYNIRSQFSRQPGQLTHCLKCGGILSISSIDSSEAVRADLQHYDLFTRHIFSYLFICDHCAWWCIRELWIDFELRDGVSDYLIVGIASNPLAPDSATAQVKIKPWLNALADPNVYDHSSNLPDDIAGIFPQAAEIDHPSLE